MAMKKKVTKTATKATAAVPNGVQQTTVPRTKVYICGKEFWTDSSAALNVLIIEMASKGMDRKQFADFSARFKLKLELWTSDTGFTKQVLCENGVVLGDWI